MENIVRRRPTADPAYPDSRVMRCAFTGHRPLKMPFGYNEEDPRCIDFKRRLHDTIEMLIWQGYTHFLSGGALGMDMYAGEIVLELRQQYPWIALEVAVPFDDQATKWPPEYRKRYDAIIKQADSAGYDILSCNSLTSDTYDRYIEVKAFRGSPHFYWSENERSVAALLGDNYFIYLVNLNHTSDPLYSPTVIQNPACNIFSSGWLIKPQSYLVQQI